MTEATVGPVSYITRTANASVSADAARTAAAAASTAAAKVGYRWSWVSKCATCEALRGASAIRGPLPYGQSAHAALTSLAARRVVHRNSGRYVGA